MKPIATLTLTAGLSLAEFEALQAMAASYATNAATPFLPPYRD